MNKQQLKRLFTGFLKNKLAEKDQQLVQRWYDSFEDLKEDQIPGLQNKYSEELLASEIRDGIYQKMNRNRFQLSWRTVGIAASLLLAVSTTIFYALYKEQSNGTAQLAFNTYSTTAKQLKKVILADSSVVYLNANSRIKVPVEFSAKERKFYLEEGEAFFEIKRDTLRPFIIRAQELNVRVLGTSFDIRAYRNSGDIKVSVASGHVRVTDAAKLHQELTINQQISYNRQTGNYIREANDKEIAKAWINGKTELHNASFDELAQAVNNVYGVKLSCNIKDVGSYRYNLVIRSDKTFDETIKLICALHNNTYRKLGDKIVIE